MADGRGKSSLSVVSILTAPKNERSLTNEWCMEIEFHTEKYWSLS